MSARAAVAALLSVLALVAAGCGGDDEKSSADGAATQTASTPDTTPTDTATAETTPTPRTVTAPTGDGNGGTTAPEKQPGGAGDEVPNATQALISGRGGKLSPSTVSVAPFIAVTVELRSSDGLDYTLRGGGKSLSAGEGRNSASATFDGLRPGKTLVLSGPQGRVVVSANADPGP